MTSPLVTSPGTMFRLHARRAREAAAAAALMAALVVAAPGAARAAAGGEVRVAVVEFGSATTDADLQPLGKGLQSMVATDLAQAPGLRVVERERLKDVLSEL